MSDLFMLFSLTIYLFGAVFFVIVSKKCFMEKWKIWKAILCFFLSPASGYIFAFGLTEARWEQLFDYDQTRTLVENILIITSVQVIVLLAFLFIYVFLIRARNKSIAMFIYLCSVMLVPSVFFLLTSRTLLPYFVYLGMHFLFYFTTVKPLAELTKKHQVTDAKLFVILPALTFVFNTIIQGFFYYTSKLSTFDGQLKEQWMYLINSDDEMLVNSAKNILRVFRDYLILETEIILYPSMFIALILIIAFYVIVRNIKFMNEAVEAEKQVKALSVQVMEALAHTIDAKDEYTKGHSIRVAKYSRMIAEQMKLPPEKCEDVYYMGLLHDLGKIGVPNEIINKPSRLTDEEYTVIKGHPMTGFDILAEIKCRPDFAIGARWHHERYDGTGYPDHKKGEEIPLEARIIAVADTYDAMTSNRSYRDYLSQDKVRAELIKCSGTQFDDNVAKAMVEIIDADTDYVLHE